MSPFGELRHAQGLLNTLPFDFLMAIGMFLTWVQYAIRSPFAAIYLLLGAHDAQYFYKWRELVLADILEDATRGELRKQP